MTIFDGIKTVQTLYETDSKYNGHVKVVQVGNTKKIKVDNIDQSISHTSQSCLRLVWGKARDVLVEEEPDLKSLMILGLGGGTMAHLISDKFPQVNITSVEIDDVMVDLAKKYFDVDKIPNHRIIVDDALRVVIEPEKYQLTEGSFQALIVDIFVGEKFPDLGRSGNFLSAIKKLVTPGGLIMFNRIYVERHQDEVNLFIDYVSESLRDVKCLVVAGYTNSDNVLIYGRV